MKNSGPSWVKIIKKASKTFYISSLFFPKDIRQDVYVLYSFLRISDDLVDATPPNKTEFIKLKEELFKVLNGGATEDYYVEAFAELVVRKKIQHQIVNDYLRIQETDLVKKTYASYKELNEFIYGVAGVVGLMMARVMGLNEESFSGAMKLASAMQNVNIIRDISEDLSAGKIYLPQDELLKFGFKEKITKEDFLRSPERYSSFIRFQLDRAKKLLYEGRESFKFIPKRFILPIKIVADIYEDVINRIYLEPQLVFEKKMKPKLRTIIKISIKNYFYGN